MDAQVLKDLHALVQGREWIALAIIVVGWLTRMLQPDSLFPLTIRQKRWLPVVAAVLSTILAVLHDVHAHKPAAEIVVNAILLAFGTLGLFALIIKAGFDGNEPTWLKRLALVFEPKIPPNGKLPVIDYEDEITSRPPKFDGKSPPSGPSLLGLILVGALSFTQQGCSAAATERFLLDTFADKLRCATDKINLPNEEILKQCAVNGDDVSRILDLIGKQRVAMAGRAAEVAQIEQERYKRQLEVVSASRCADAGAR